MLYSGVFAKRFSMEIQITREHFRQQPARRRRTDNDDNILFHMTATAMRYFIPSWSIPLRFNIFG